MKRIALFILAINLAGLTGCTGILSNKGQEVGAMKNEVELTQEKKEFLIKMSVDEERVQNGRLYGWQEEVLCQYDFAMDYLKKKYPSHTFKFTYCNPKGNVNPFSMFLFKADNEEEIFKLYLYIDDSHIYSCKDNYYGELLKDSYNTVFFALLQEYFSECIGVSSYFTNIEGEECGETLAAEKVLEGEQEIPNTVYIYAVQPDNFQAKILAEKIEELIKEKEIYGDYYIKILSSNPDGKYTGDDLKTYVLKKENTFVIYEQKFSQ